MNQPEPTPENIAHWDRWFAVEMNNLAWDLADQPGLTAVQEEEMLNAAHASAMHWDRVGTKLNKIRADMLLGHVHALLGNGLLATAHAQRSFTYVTTHDSPDWEVGFAHAILANAACASGDVATHGKHHARAKALGDAIQDEADREIFRRTFARVPVPATPPA